ncbi:MAG: hypothetical protein ACPL4I_01060 [Bacteroidota bacterium]
MTKILGATSSSFETNLNLLLSLTLAFVLLATALYADVGDGSMGSSRQTKRGGISVEKITYNGWQNCYRISNGIVELVVTTDVGPRIIRFGFVNEENEFKEFADQLGKTGGDKWLPYGGHRLWHAPEDPVRTYYPDNFPVKFEQHENFVRLIQPVEKTTGIQKEIDIKMSPAKAEVEVIHRLKNTNLWAVELAPWALSVMAPGGVGIFPLPPRGSHPENLLPTSVISLWAYTDMSDPRWTWGRKYVLLRQHLDAKTPQKGGFMDLDGWAGYARNGHLFIKKFAYISGAKYPDLGCNAETWTNSEILEVESLGPLTRIDPDAFVEHTEHWFLFKGVPMPKNDDDVDKYILPVVKEVIGR